jgi:hypothetical protein
MREDGDVLEVVVRAMVGDMGIGEEVAKGRNGVFKHLSALSERNAKGVEVALRGALADTDD